MQDLLDAAACNGVGECCFWIVPGWDEFLGQEALVAGVFDRLDNRRVVEFLGLVDLMTPGAACGVVMADVGSCGFDGGHDVFERKLSPA